MDNILDKLRNDADYYGAFGKQFLSASDVGVLLTNPSQFKQDSGDDKALAQGRLFHQFLLEPEKATDTLLADVSTRTTKAYKEMLDIYETEFILLQKEYDEAKEWAEAMTSNIYFFDVIYDPNAKYELPAVGQIGGVMWKGKADIVLPDMVVDLKTTRDINRFRYSAASYNYDAQCYVYQELFGKPLVFYAVDKETKQLGVFKPTENFVKRGKDKVMRAIEVYNKFFSEKAVENVQNHYVLEELD